MLGAHLLGMSPASSDPRTRRRTVALIVAGIVLLLLAGVGIYGLLTGPRTTTNTGPDSEPGQAATTPTSPPTAPKPPQVASVPRSTHPAAFAQGVAATLFAWDTASGLWPLDYTSAILAVGDPSGDEQAGLASDVAAYLPNREAWIELRQYATRQHLTIDTAHVPAAWADAVAQARPGQLAPGTTAITIEGTRHRAGVWNGQSVTSEHPVAFTVFVVCAPTYQSCHLLRLSQLDNPLR